MTLEQIYHIAGGKLEDSMQRIPNEKLLLKLIGMFVSDPGKAALDQAVSAKDPEAAFKAVHGMKGVCLNLGFDDISKSCRDLTEDLRPGTFSDGWENHYQKLCAEYDALINAIKALNA